jgi:DNA-directed RNA polymerase subunit RPC12/RpoP
MSRYGKSLKVHMCKCVHCRSQYDLRAAVRRSDEELERDIKCPNCLKVVGRI